MDFELAAAVEVLERTPGVLRSLLSGLDRRWTDRDYGEGTWSPREVVAHLIFGERTDWIPRARHILAHADAVPFAPFDRAGHKGLMQGRTVGDLLDEFERERAGSLAALRALGLTPERLRTRGRHPALGGAALSELLAAWVVHDLNHIAQVCKGMAFQYRSASGPWEAYLSILSPTNPR